MEGVALVPVQEIHALLQRVAGELVPVQEIHALLQRVAFLLMTYVYVRVCMCLYVRLRIHCGVEVNESSTNKQHHL